MNLKRFVALLLSVLPITAISFAAKAYAQTGSKDISTRSSGPAGHGSVSVN